MAREYQNDPVTVDVVGRGQSEAANTVEHRAVLTPMSESGRIGTLADVISVFGGTTARTIVFTGTKRECDELCVSAALSTHNAQPLHGDVSQARLRPTPSPPPQGMWGLSEATSSHAVFGGIGRV